MEIGLKLAVARSGRPSTPKLTVPMNSAPGVMVTLLGCLRAPSDRDVGRSDNNGEVDAHHEGDIRGMGQSAVCWFTLKWKEGALR